MKTLQVRNAFTMIELIFVIVILGILSAVALPKFIGVSEQAVAGKCQAFVGTLNRTTGSALWAGSISNGDKGSLGADASAIRTAIESQIEIPQECLDASTNSATVFATSDTLTIGTKTYDVNFTDGTLNSAPVWGWKPN